MSKIFFFLVPVGFAWFLLSNSGGAASVQNVDRTSSPLGVGSCGSCHSGGNYTPVISTELLDNNSVVTKYSPGKQYQVRVTIVAGNNPRGYGFQMVSLSGNNNVQGGSFGTAPAGFNKVTLNNRVYVEQSSTRTSGTFIIPWTAPVVGTGSVRFYSAGVAVNGSNGTGGDSHVQAALPLTVAEDVTSISLSSSSVSFPSSGGTQSVEITSNTNWTASESLSFLSLSPTSGINNGTITLNCDPNTSTVSRTGTITVSGTGATSKTITITQAGLTPVLNVTPSSLTFQDTGGVQSISIESNMTWNLTESLAFLSLNATSGSNNKTIEVSCQPNNTTLKRTGSITLSGTGVPTKTINITQNAAAPQLSVSPKEMFFDQSGGNQSLSISANTSWTIIENLSYLSLNQTSGTNNSNITVTCQSNTSSVSRSGLLKVVASGLDTQIINISQIGATTLLNVTPGSMTFNSSGGTQKGLITSNTTWEVQENLTYIKVDSLSGVNNGGINITCDSNFSAVTRTGMITIIGKGAVNKTINISQTGVPGFMSVSPNALEFNEAGGKLYFLVKSNTNWTVSESLAHISLNKTTGSNADTVWVTCSPNTTTISKTGQITITGVGVSSQIVTVNQKGEQPRLVVNPLNLAFTSAAGTKTLTLTSNIPWTISDSAAYLSSNVTTGSNNATITITCNANTSALPRNTTLYIAGTGVSTIAIPVTQTGATATMTLSPVSLLFPSIGGEKSFNITSNTNWNIIDTFSNLKFIPQSGINNGIVKVICDTNFSTSLQSYTIGVSGIGLSNKSITISQSGAEEIFSASPATLAFSAAGGNKTFQISSNTSWALAESGSFLSVDPAFGEFSKLITVTCDSNYSAIPRKGKITFTGKSDASISVDISQSGVSPVFNVLPDSIIIDSSAAQSAVKIGGNTAWIVTKDSDWFSVNTFSGSGSYNLLISVTDNQVMQERMGKIQIKSIQADSLKTVFIRQKGKKLQLPTNWQVKSSNIFHTIILPTQLISNIDGQPLNIGDFIGIFYKYQDKEFAAGYGAWTGAFTQFKIFGDDLTTSNIKEGLSIGESFIIKIWQVKTKKVINAQSEFAPIGTQGLVVSTDKFTNGGISMISRLSGTSTPVLNILENKSVGVFPNPAKHFVQVQPYIDFAGPAIFEIYDANGQCIQKHIYKEGWKAEKILNLDFTELSQGIYQLRWLNNDFSWLGKVVIIK